jgi:cation diffusion facilitator CzcD-associated flavoprotein CzcO
LYVQSFPRPDCAVTSSLLTHSHTLADWQDLVDSQGLRPHIRCSHTYLHATWDPKSNSYCITFSTHNRKIIVEANILVSAIGVFTAPKLPGIPGLELFPPDRAIHVARWPVGLEKEQLKGKTVAVIGNGCSG